MAVHQRLVVFELRVLAPTTPTIDLTTPQAAVASLRADVDATLDAQVPKSDSTLHNRPYYVSMPRGNGPEREVARARKKERIELEATRRASLVDEEGHKIREHELVAEESSSRLETV